MESFAPNSGWVIKWHLYIHFPLTVPFSIFFYYAHFCLIFNSFLFILHFLLHFVISTIVQTPPFPHCCQMGSFFCLSSSCPFVNCLHSSFYLFCLHCWGFVVLCSIGMKKGYLPLESNKAIIIFNLEIKAFESTKRKYKN